MVSYTSCAGGMQEHPFLLFLETALTANVDTVQETFQLSWEMVQAKSDVLLPCFKGGTSTIRMLV